MIPQPRLQRTVPSHPRGDIDKCWHRPATLPHPPATTTEPAPANDIFAWPPPQSSNLIQTFPSLPTTAQPQLSGLKRDRHRKRGPHCGYKWSVTATTIKKPRTGQRYWFRHAVSVLYSNRQRNAGSTSYPGQNDTHQDTTLYWIDQFTVAINHSYKEIQINRDHINFLI